MFCNGLSDFQSPLQIESDGESPDVSNVVGCNAPKKGSAMRKSSKLTLKKPASKKFRNINKAVSLCFRSKFGICVSKSLIIATSYFTTHYMVNKT